LTAFSNSNSIRLLKIYSNVKLKAIVNYPVSNHINDQLISISFVRICAKNIKASELACSGFRLKSGKYFYYFHYLSYSFYFSIVFLAYSQTMCMSKSQVAVIINNSITIISNAYLMVLGIK